MKTPDDDDKAVMLLLLELAGFLTMLIEGHSPANLKDQARILIDKIARSL